MKPLKLIKNEFKTDRILPEQKPKPLSPPKFDDELVDMTNPGIKWLYGVVKYWGR